MALFGTAGGATCSPTFVCPVFQHLHSSEMSFTGEEFGLTRPGEAYDAAPGEEAPFSRILCRIPTDPKLEQNRLAGLEAPRRSRMVCNFVPQQISQNDNFVPEQISQKEPSLEGNGDKDIRFHRILRENRDSESSRVQQVVRRAGLDSGGFERIRRSGREQRATTGDF